MKVRMRSAGEVQLLDLDGDLTIAKGELALRESVRQLLATNQVKILLNLSAVAHIDSSGLGEIVASRKRARAQGGDVKIVVPQNKVYRVLSTSRLTEILGVYHNETEAIAAF